MVDDVVVAVDTEIVEVFEVVVEVLVLVPKFAEFEPMQDPLELNVSWTLSTNANSPLFPRRARL